MSGAMGPLKTITPSMPTWAVMGCVASISRFRAVFGSSVLVGAVTFAVGATVAFATTLSTGGAVAAMTGTTVGRAPGTGLGVAVRGRRVGVAVRGPDAMDIAAGTRRV